MSLRAVFNHEGQTTYVVPQRHDKIEPNDEIYDSKRHAGRITNEAGDPVTFIDYVPAAGGDLYPPRRAHFRVKAEGRAPAQRKEAPVGYRIYINTGSQTELFEHRQEAVEQRKALSHLKQASVKSADDLLKLMTKMGPEAWHQSKIIHLNHVIDAPQFLIRYGRGADGGKRFIDFARRL